MSDEVVSIVSVWRRDWGVGEWVRGVWEQQRETRLLPSPPYTHGVYHSQGAKGFVFEPHQHGDQVMANVVQSLKGKGEGSG